MSSILTNMAAMSAVQNLAATQRSLASTQDQISTGLAVSSAQDNAAYYSIAQTMRTSVSNISAVSSSLNLGSSVVSTATAATGQVTSILQSISADLVTAKSNIGNTQTQSYLQTAITALSQQLSSIVSSASFNGTNLLDGSSGTSVSFVSGLTGSGANTTINSLSINTSATNLSGATTAATSAYNTAFTNYGTAQSPFNTAVSALTTTDYTTADSAFTAVFGSSASAATNSAGDLVVTGMTASSTAGTLMGTSGSFNVSKNTFTTTGTTATTGGALYNLGGTNATGFAGSNYVTQGTSGGAMNSAGGALFAIGQIQLKNASSNDISAFIAQVGASVTAVNTASEQLGAASSQITLQSTYISSLSSSLTAGVGSLVDADMNEASTRLSALQTQQQLGVQALSVANQSSQLILKLFQ